MLIGLVLLVVLVARGLDYGPLQTDVLIFRAWYQEYGPTEFARHYLEVNQRHILTGPLRGLMFSLVGEKDLVYNLISFLNRVLQGTFLTGVVFQLTRRRLLAISIGLALTFTVIRVPELYKGIIWVIESSLTLLLAGAYAYLVSLRRQTWRALWYTLAVICYAISVLIYEAGLPWIAVFFILGWLVREGVPLRTRFLYCLRDVVLFAVWGMGVAFFVLVLLDPWTGLKPYTSSFVELLLRHLATLLTFPALYLNDLRTMLRDGYGLLLGVFALIGVAAMLGLARVVPEKDAETDDSQLRRDYLNLALLGAAVLLFSVLVGASTQGASTAYLDRMTFGRSVGIAILYVTALFAILEWSGIRWRYWLAAGLIGVLMVGVGFTRFWMLQDYAHFSLTEVERLTTAILNVRPMLASPLHLIVITEPDWPVSRFADTSDLIIHEVQQNLWQQGGDATLDMLHTGAYEDVYATYPGTCDTVSGVDSSGICLDEDGIRSSRWAYGKEHLYTDIVLVRYDHRAGEMTVLPAIPLTDLTDYNVTTAGPTILESNVDRILVPPAGN